MPKPVLNNIANLNRVIHFNDWNITFLTLPSVGTASQFNAQLNLRAISADLPRKNITPIQVDIRGHRFWVPGDKEFESTLTVQLLEQTDVLVLRFLEEWFQACYGTFSGSKGPVDNLKATLRMELLDRQLNPRWIYEVSGVWPQTIDLGSNLVGDKGADIVRPTITFNYDWYVVKAFPA